MCKTRKYQICFWCEKCRSHEELEKFVQTKSLGKNIKEFSCKKCGNIIPNFRYDKNNNLQFYFGGEYHDIEEATIHDRDMDESIKYLLIIYKNEIIGYINKILI